MKSQEKARQLIQAGDLERALVVWQQIADAHPTADDLYEYGALLHQLYLNRQATLVFRQLAHI